MPKRTNPRDSLFATAAIFNERRGKIIVEIGGLAQAPGDKHFELFGGSVLVWAQQTTAERIYSVDIDPRVARRTRKHTQEFENVEAVVADGVAFIKAFDQPIDLLYLDACGPDSGADHQRFPLDVFEAAMPNLHSDSLVLVDDTDLGDRSKGLLVVPRALLAGFEVLWSGRQTLLARAGVVHPGCSSRSVVG
ncbi:MAG: hypothetical protein GC159_17730 [Phycisphaera sp.]|nr:hypothetical protein [Phycisphaera sp.]